MNYTKLVIGGIACLVAGASAAAGHNQHLPGLFTYTALSGAYGLYMLARGAKLI